MYLGWIVVHRFSYAEIYHGPLSPGFPVVKHEEGELVSEGDLFERKLHWLEQQTGK